MKAQESDAHSGEAKSIREYCNHFKLKIGSDKNAPPMRRRPTLPDSLASLRHTRCAPSERSSWTCSTLPRTSGRGCTSNRPLARNDA